MRYRGFSEVFQEVFEEFSTGFWVTEEFKELQMHDRGFGGFQRGFGAISISSREFSAGYKSLTGNFRCVLGG